MRVKCGVDIIEISRIQDSIEKLGDAFLNKVYTKKEIEYCESKGKNKYQHYAARFAVKEAAFKAVSEGVEDKFAISWKDVETVNDEHGRPKTEILFLYFHYLEVILLLIRNIITDRVDSKSNFRFAGLTSGFTKALQD